MPHKLIETSGPAVKITGVSAGMGDGQQGRFHGAMMARMGCSPRSRVVFTKADVSMFTTKAGED